MKARELYDAIFTEYASIGYAPAIVAIAVGAAICAVVIFGGVTLGKHYFAAPAAQTSHS